MLKIWKC